MEHVWLRWRDRLIHRAWRSRGKRIMALCSQSGAEGAQGLQGAGGVEARVPVACQEDTGGGATNIRPCLVTSGWGAWVGGALREVVRLSSLCLSVTPFTGVWAVVCPMSLSICWGRDR